MDGAKTMAKLVVAAGLISLWTGFAPGALMRPLRGLGHRGDAPLLVSVTATDPARVPAPAPLADPSWFDRAKPYCDAVEVSDDRWRAAGVVFDAGHPAADAGDDVAAGPLMELVVDFWPNHYMALYHAGTARDQRGDRAEARARFLENYDQDDGWTGSAHEMSASMATTR